MIQISRIKYEAFARFSVEMNNCFSIEEVRDCLLLNLKYLFNYHFVRFNYSFRGKVFIHFNIGMKHASTARLDRPDHYTFEDEVLRSGKPLLIPSYDTKKLSVAQLEDGLEAELWSWNFTNQGRQILATLIASDEKPFGPKDINFLKLVANNLESKLLELCLLEELDNANKEIQDINNRQKEIIHSRTKEVEEKNKLLLEMSIHNAHKIREPLTRIMGLIGLVDENTSQDELLTQIIPRLQKSSNDFDEVLQEHISRSTQFLVQLKETVADEHNAC